MVSDSLLPGGVGSAESDRAGAEAGADSRGRRDSQTKDIERGSQNEEYDTELWRLGTAIDEEGP
jgi:hypothetical protein